mmetsp:Transcript_2770/g.8232  ORF Transcript_2770/g.8232 Transcript_2770/m.8232 type:complete len:235 (+) Transcript_2770:140-844(+)
MPVARSDSSLNRGPQHILVRLAVRNGQGRDTHGASIGKGAAGVGEIRRQAGLLRRQPPQRRRHDLLCSGGAAAVCLIITEELCAGARAVGGIGTTTLGNRGANSQGSVGVVRVHPAARALPGSVLVCGRTSGHKVHVTDVDGRPVRPRLLSWHECSHGHRRYETLDRAAAPVFLGELADLLGRKAFHGCAQRITYHEAEQTSARTSPELTGGRPGLCHWAGMVWATGGGLHTLQ